MKPQDIEEELCRSSLPFQLRECSPHHVQVVDNGKPIIDVWPAKNKFMRHEACQGEKAQVGTVSDLMKIAYAIAGMSANASTPRKSDKKVTLRDLASQMLPLMQEGNIKSVTLSDNGDLTLFHHRVHDPSIPF